MWRHPVRISVREEGEGHSMWRSQTEKVPTNSGEYGTMNLETESIRSRADSMGGCVKLKTVTEIRQSSTHFVFITDNVKPKQNEAKPKQACTNDASVCRTDQLIGLQFSWDTRRHCNAKSNYVKRESVKPVNNINRNCLAYLWSTSFLSWSAKANDKTQLATLQNVTNGMLHTGKNTYPLKQANKFYWTENHDNDVKKAWSYHKHIYTTQVTH